MNKDIHYINVQEDWVLCRVFHKTKSDQDTTETTTTKHTTSHFTFDAMMAESSSYYLLPNNVEFLPSYNSNGLLPLDINLEETSFNGSSYGVGDSNSEEMKYEIIDNNIHNNAFPFNYFVA